MNTKPIKRGIKSVFNELKRRDTDILIGFGVAGMIFGTVSAIKATPKALTLIEEKKAEENKEKLDVKETIKTTWKCYAPTVAIEAIAVACIIFSTVKSNKRRAALAMAYGIANNTLMDYQDKVIETIGEKKELAIRDKLAKDQLERNPVENAIVEKTGVGNTLCWNGYSGGYFESSYEAIGRAVNEANDYLNHNDYISLNDFLEFLHLRADTQQGNLLGWNKNDGLISVVRTYETATDGSPCLVFTFRTPPYYYYYNDSRKKHLL